MNIKSQSLILLVLICLMPCESMGLKRRATRNGRIVPTAGGRVFERLAKNIIDYLDLKERLKFMRRFGDTDANDLKFEKSDDEEQYEGVEKCQSLEDIGDYFFQVYSDDDELRNMSREGLEEILSFQLNENTRDKDLKSRRKKHKCARDTCIQSKEITQMTKIGLSGYFTREDFATICPVMLYNFELRNCEYTDEDDTNLSRGEIWGIGMVFAGIVTIWSWNGAVVIPFIKSKVYKRSLTVMISLAFGVLSGNSILNYLPKADGMDNINLDETDYTYFYKHLIIMFVLYFFFLFERSMKLITLYKTLKRKEKLRREGKLPPESSDSGSESDSDDSDSSGHISIRDITENGNNNNGSIAMKQMGLEKKHSMKKPRFKRNESIDVNEINILGVHNLNEVTDKMVTIGEEDEDDDNEDEESRQVVFTINNGSANRAPKLRKAETVSSEIYQFKSIDVEPNVEVAEKASKKMKKKKERAQKPDRICCTSLTKGIPNVRPIGWMAIFGDGLGNFIDGLSIGASINQGLLVGLTTAIATWFANIPQELGDFALLVRAGMTPFQALFYNFMSAQSCYIGFAIGAIFGENILAARWIFSISSATGLYLSLGVLMPEMNEEFDDNKETLNEKLKITGLQILGISIGYAIMIGLNILEEEF